jgi:HSP20 family protein
MNTVSLFTPRFTTNFFDAFDREFLNYASKEEKMSKPLVDVRELDNAYILEMELPGLDENNIDISLKDNVLSIASLSEAVKEESHEEGKKEVKEPKKDLVKARDEQKDEAKWLIRERKSYSFTRRFTLPKDIDENAVSAQFKNGLLTITLNRKEEAQAKTIKISA